MPKRMALTIPGQEDGPRFLGIDRRDPRSGANPNSVWDAINADLTVGGFLHRRDCFVEFAELPAASIGLYSIGGDLRVAVPSGNGLGQFAPPGMIFDEFGDSDSVATSTSRYTRVSDQTSWGVNEKGAMPYLVLETSSGQYVHHWINNLPTGFSDPVKTRVEIGFEPGPDIEKLQGKILAADRFRGLVRFCSTEFGPGIWSETAAPADAGFIDPSQHALSNIDITGITTHQGRLIVVYDNAMQVWAMDPDPSNHVFETALNGPGTQVFASLRPVIGDLFYFSEGGFRSLATQTVTGELRQGDLGAPILPLSQLFKAATNSEVRSLWSQARSQYLCAFNDTDAGTADVFAYTHVPSIGVFGWTRWQLPFTVDYWVELNGVLYIRSGNIVYRSQTAGQFDYPAGTATPFFMDLQSQFLDGGEPRGLKQWYGIDLAMDGKVHTLKALVDQRDRSIQEDVAFALEDTTYDDALVPLGSVTHALAIRILADEDLTLYRMNIDAILLTGAG